MAKISPAKKQHRSMRGKTVDMDLLRKRNELTPAVGNARVNARGDELGPGGMIVKKREEIVKEHYATAGQVRSGINKTTIVADQPEAVAEVKKTTSRTKKEAPVVEEPLTVAEQELLDEDSEWVEDDNGNFVPKG